ncbi:MAG: flagellar basal body P-ring formation protein FlgA [Burkholderiales bacterium]|nr:flagellar basal body P-ring formation protein FlgA [Burkholderiales bacterium]
MHRFFTFVCLALIAASVHAATQDIPSIRQAVKAFVTNQTAGLPGDVGVEVGEVDPRLTLPACPMLEPFLAENGRLWGNSTVGVKCRDKWTIYVPVKIRVMSNIVMSARPLAQGTSIGPQDVMLRKGDLAESPPGILTDAGEAVGKTMASSIPSGYPISRGMLHSPLIVLQGQSVRLISSGKGFQVTSDGIALGAAADGQTVQVRTPSGQIVSGIVRPGPVVEVGF